MKKTLCIILLAFGFSDFYAQQDYYLCPIKLQVYFRGPVSAISVEDRAIIETKIQRGLQKKLEEDIKRSENVDTVVYSNLFRSLDSSAWIGLQNILYPATTTYDYQKKRLNRHGSGIGNGFIRYMNTRQVVYERRAKLVLDSLYQRHQEVMALNNGLLYLPIGICEFYPHESSCLGSADRLIGRLGVIIVNCYTKKVDYGFYRVQCASNYFDDLDYDIRDCILHSKL